jgi:hypothetical protein
MARLKTDDKKQTARFGFTCTEAEAKEIRALAEVHGFNQHSVFLRLVALGIVPVDRKKLTAKFGVAPPVESAAASASSSPKPAK